MVGTDASKRTISELVASVADRISDSYLQAALSWAERLPSEREMAEGLGVSRGTVRHALQFLADEGAVVNVPQSGWYSSATTYPAPRGPLLSLSASAALRGSKVENRLIRLTARLPREQESLGLGLSLDEHVLAMSRARVLAGQTMCVEHHVISLTRAPGLERSLEAGASLYDTLERHGAKPVRSDLTARAALAGKDAAHLGVDPGSPVLVEDEVVTGEYRQPLMLARAVWRADLYRFRATFTSLSPSGASGPPPDFTASSEVGSWE
ncbi:GntR family transcriptional regulator [Microbacterium aurugineum]|uniref:GntR family transcriptional regulator n=1 Tax=Microbacterium aurugineum TaxID=2851642 RepID=UPI0020BDD491|nr:GntR family transcriptional regulator [Microbacterium aurugineum]MCK8478290.1 GntR family transcriptional regulator [Microbacterium aurugineum]